MVRSAAFGPVTQRHPSAVSVLFPRITLLIFYFPRTFVSEADLTPTHFTHLPTWAATSTTKRLLYPHTLQRTTMANAYYHALTVPLNLTIQTKSTKSEVWTQKPSEQTGTQKTVALVSWHHLGGDPRTSWPMLPSPHPVELELQPHTPASLPSHAAPPTPP